MTEQELLDIIRSATKPLNKDYKLLERTLYPGARKPKKRKIKRFRDAKKIL
jgi:hypothetical protein